ncbi:MAG: ATP-binding protein [Bacteroidetes bacterium]|nr:ATP-binding protein [Bacteroidota bacterium]
MKSIQRILKARIKQYMWPNKVIVLLGARRTGKTILLREIEKEWEGTVLKLNGEDLSTHALLATRTVANYKRLLGSANLLLIDEAQKVPDIGQVLKLMVDELPGLHILVSGSSQFDLSTQVGEPLTGRKFSFQLFPFSQEEYAQLEQLPDTHANLEERLIYGSYPELIHYSGNQEKQAYLEELVNSYLLKDILELDGIRNAGKMLDLLRLIAYQTGKEVSLDELGRQLAMSKNTVDRYLDLLSKVFVLFKLSGFSRNLRKEVVKSSKWYFYDNGIRNAIIANFNPLKQRNDTGELWENYLIAERKKHLSYRGIACNTYFWRTYQQQELDWLEEREGKLFAYEFKWNSTKKVKVPSAWTAAYPDAEFEVIHPGNYLDWVAPINL